ncbi:putative RNA polymerase sigma factor FecI [Lacunisphaera limnophila]|uniref:Putative RNA polymerase sigma factor FecI n=1 Tax=Lacunisphaera limnophila TaxID=1838286 RepID=A0A1D8AVP7_9BACT|nr:sigma-70 family RNA polymerase sigma factor [Lacunisphaera limnophila]AOS44953.1 putative RNA polymerase sigma factor FecI [Lacunisphaera limnophila]
MSELLPPSRDFAGLYRRTVAPLRRHLARILGNPAEAQDVAHDAYLRVFPVVEKQSAEKPEALLYTTARRLAFNRLKRRRIAAITPDSPAIDGMASAAPGVVQQVMARQELQQLESAIAALPEGCRTVLLLRKVELLSHQEIADRLGLAVSSVEKHHARALRLLRVALQPAADRPGPAPTQEARP